MYENLFDEKHRLVKASGLNVLSKRESQSGENESDLLCRDCDNKKLGRLEDYAKRVLYSGNLGESQKIEVCNQLHPDGKLTSTYCKNINYVKFKLFLLSILWRSSISRGDFFTEVCLRKKEEILRKMLYEEDPKSQLDFPCVILSFKFYQRKIASFVISSPRKIKSEKGTYYVFQIGQLVMMFFVSPEDVPNFVTDAAITPEGRMRIIHLDEENGKDLMNKIFGKEITAALYLHT
ncbi:MAG: hypothetical protein RL150_187 [Candidatus Parcubacteria bacterium]|jgi:hypothetical protein